MASTTTQLANLIKDTAPLRVAIARDINIVTSLDTYRWKNRLLLVFAPSENNSIYQRQMQLLAAHKAGLNERNLLVFKLVAEGTSHLESQSIDATDVARLRSQFKVSQEEFRVILVGKDGTEKWHASSPVEPQVIFKEIDAMPMRQQEMRSQEQ